MANTIIGKIVMIGDMVAIPSKDGSKSFNKRELLLDCTRYDSMTGEPRENFPQFEFSGNRCADLDRFKVGDIVKVSFVVMGVMYEDKTTHVKKNFTKVQGYKVEYHQQTGYVPFTASLSSPVNTAPCPSSTDSTEKLDDFPF